MIVLEPGSDSTPSLASDEVHVWQATLGIDGRAEALLDTLLSAEERARAARFRQPEDRCRYQVGRGLLRQLVGSHLRLDPCAVRFVLESHGKPGLAAADVRAKLQFNVSHSGDRVLVAITRGRRVGVDVECLDRGSEIDRIAERFFAPPEIALLSGRPAAQRAALFLRLWVLKEALVKGLGLGIAAMGLREFAIDPDAVPGPCIRPLTGSADAALANWCVAELPAPGACAAAIAFEGSVSRVRLFHWPEHLGRMTAAR